MFMLVVVGMAASAFCVKSTVPTVDPMVAMGEPEVVHTSGGIIRLILSYT